MQSLDRFAGLYTTVDRQKPLPTLPIELFDDIFYFLDTPSRLRFIQTCRATRQRFRKSTVWRVVDFSPVVSVRQLMGIRRFLSYTLTRAARASVREFVLDNDWVFKDGMINIHTFLNDTINTALTLLPNLELFSIRGYSFDEIFPPLFYHFAISATSLPNLRRLNFSPSVPSYASRNHLHHFLRSARLDQVTTDIRSCMRCNIFPRWPALRCDGCDQFLPACRDCLGYSFSAWFFCPRCRYRGYCNTCCKMPVTRAISVCACGRKGRPVKVCRPCDKDIARNRKVGVQGGRCSWCQIKRAFAWLKAVTMVWVVMMMLFCMWPLLLFFLGLAYVIRIGVGVCGIGFNQLNSGKTRINI